jgi:HPt (histidine-containing phosphotransfer) domain-containing protein
MTAQDLDIDDLILRMDLEDEDDVREVVGFFLEAAALRLVELQGAVKNREPASIQHHAHAAKGAAKSVGAEVLANHLAAMERALAHQDWPEIEARGNQLASSLDKVGATLANWVPNFNEAE